MSQGDPMPAARTTVGRRPRVADGTAAASRFRGICYSILRPPDIAGDEDVGTDQCGAWARGQSRGGAAPPRRRRRRSAGAAIPADEGSVPRPPPSTAAIGAMSPLGGRRARVTPAGPGASSRPRAVGPGAGAGTAGLTSAIPGLWPPGSGRTPPGLHRLGRARRTDLGRRRIRRSRRARSGSASRGVHPGPVSLPVPP